MALPTPPLPDWLVQWATKILKQELNYLLYFERNINDLEDQVNKLRLERQKLGDRVAEDEDRHGREIYDDVSKWLDGADTIIDAYKKFEKEEEEAHGKCLAGFPPNLPARYFLSKKSIEIKGKAESQLQKAKFDIISRSRGPPSVGLVLSNVDYQSLPSRVTAMEEITNALKDTSARMIGVHGPSGVGKTTLVMEAVNRVQNDQEKPKLFDVVIMANVTKSPNIRKIQGQIADMLWMKLDEESEEGRASRIRERLKKEKESTLIILDDLYGKVDLNILGIPWQSGDGKQKNPKGKKSLGSSTPNEETKQQALADGVMMNSQKASDASSSSSASNSVIALTTEERYKGCKVLLISEVRQVLNQMDVRSKLVVPLELLNEKDARKLFNKIAGIGDKNTEFGELPAQIVEKCDGLPMSLVTTAKALKGRSRLVWQDTYQKFETQTMTGTPEHSTRVIYDLLENEELRITFLLCACMDNDALVSDLVRACIGLGFLRGIYTVKDTRSRVQVMLMKLRESGLLADSYSSDRYTMQNLVRNAALSIAFKERHMLMLNKVRVDEWPDDDEVRRYVAISLRHCDIIDAITKRMTCARLKILEVINNDPQLKLPKKFFEQMEELKVLILTGINLSPSDSSVGCLTKLRMLCLEHCTLSSSKEELSLSEELSIIKNLKNLRILSFSGSNIDCLPVELGDLSKLQTLDISNCPKLRVIPPDVISRLTSLEELYMRKTQIQWPKVINGDENDESENASLLELGELNQLTNLDIQIQSVDHLPENLFFDKLSSYKIVIGSSNGYLERDFKMPEKHELSRFLAIHQKGGIHIHSHKGIKMLFERVEYLLLGKLNGVQDLFYELNLKGFPHLKYLAIQNNHDIQFLIHPKDREEHHEKAFEKLETLELHKVTQIEGLCFHKVTQIEGLCFSSCLLSESSFANLKAIKINFCEKLKYLFSRSLLEHLTALETIQASDCDSLKVIVPDESEMLKLPKLHNLTLQSLKSFSGFYPISTTTTTSTKILFHEKVEVSELERLELRSIEIDQIWNDQSSDFGNLIHLDVSGCNDLISLLPFSLAKNLKKLQSLYVSECYRMENIFADVPVKVAKDATFPNLKNIKLSRMSSLKKIWNLNLPVEKLDTLVIEKCNQLVSVFGHDMEGIFQGLSSLTVTDCKSMETIFDLTCDQNRYARHYETLLRDVHLESLGKLERIVRCEQDQEGTLQLKSLQNITVHGCRKLVNIFPFSIAKHQLKKLQRLVVSDCSKLKEIVAVQNGTSDNSGSSTCDPDSLVFPELTSIKFSKLPKFKNFCPEHCKLECEKLDELSIELCRKLELFGESQLFHETFSSSQAATSAQRKPLFPEEVMNKLRSMHIELQHTSSSSRYRRDKLEVLRLSWLEDTEILFRFLHSNPNLKSLWLDNCLFYKLVESQEKSSSDGNEKIGVVPKLKTLRLTNLSCLMEIGFEHDAILQRIESLLLENCPKLDNIVPSEKKIRFNFLTNLEVVECKCMKYVMTLSTAKSLGQLVKMKITNCESLKDIIVSDRQIVDEVNEQSRTNNKIVFKQMKALELVSLKNLKSFCSSKIYSLEFPLLEKFVVSACPKMEKFSEKEIKTMPTIMQKVYVVRDEEKRLCWNGDLRATIEHIYNKKKYYEGMDKISVSEHSVLEEGWKTEKALDKGWFHSLKTLTLERCKFESFAIPSFVLRCLKSLKELEVRNCKNITCIFEMNDIKGTFQLEKLTLEELPNVTHVWPQQDKQNDSRFRNLQQVSVKSCRKLKALFPVAIATNLKMLEQLEVHFCDELREIVEKDSGGGGETKKFVFLYLTRLRLYNLPQLAHFYDGMFTFECPELNILYPFNCNKFDLFQTPQGNSPPITRPPLFSNIKDISKVKTLSMKSKDTWVLKSWLQQSEDLELEYLRGLMLTFDDDVNNEYSTLQCEILGRRTPKLQRMGIMNSTSLKKILFPHQNPKFLEHLEYLSLSCLFELSSIGGLDCLAKLQELIVWRCPLLRAIEQYPTNLKKLNVVGCHGLQCLLTSSAAGSLKHLEELYVYDCKSLKDIVQKEQDDETATEEIIFEQLKRISLQHLRSLECFYQGNAALKLPSLAQVKIWMCSKMTIFSQQLRDEDPSRKIQASLYEPDVSVFTIFSEQLRDVDPSRKIQASLYDPHDLVFEFSQEVLNVVLGKQFLYQTALFLNNYPELEGKWVGSSEIPVEWSFIGLKYLEVDGCDFLTNAVLPSHLLPLLSNLEQLQVRKCKHVEAIFDVKDTSAKHDDPVTFRLRTIVLKELPSMRHVWNNDPKASPFSFPFLEGVGVQECKRIKNLFPASVPRDYLRHLDVRKCGELEEIVAKDEAFPQDANNKEIDMLFPQLTFMVLWALPELRCICSGMQNLLDQSVVLTRLYVFSCPKLKAFAADILNSYPGGEDCFATDDDKHSFVSSAQKVITSTFEELVLSKEDVTMIEKGLLHVDLQNLNYLGLDSFNDNESDEFPDVFFSKVSLPKLTEIQLVDCAFKDIFRPKGPDIDYSKILSQLKYLEINKLHNLYSMGFEHLWMAPLLEMLETLKVSECNLLKNLAASSAVSFFYLTQLKVENCARLKYLFKSSTAKSLGALRELSITKCELLEVVVAHEEGDKPEDMILLSKLGTLSLNELPKLESFYTGNSTLYFPGLCSSLLCTITKCNKMKTFSHGDVLPKFMQGKIDEDPWHGDLNAAVQKHFQKASIITTTYPWTYMDLLPTERSLLLLSFITLAQSANSTLKKKQRRTLELPAQCPPEYNENVTG
ncbi:Disease resistance protein [Arachis hypogaea]|nr:Disease resistance protein [Arachis hypogaea]